MKEFTEQDYASIDRYIHNDLSDKDRLAFKKRLLSEPDLATETKWVKRLYVNYEHVGQQDKYIGLQTQVRDIHQKLSAQGALVLEPLERPRPVPSWFAMAACLLLVSGLSVWYWQTHQPVEQHFAKHATKKLAPKVSPTSPISNSVTMPVTPPSPSPDQLAARYGSHSPRGIGEVPGELDKAIADYKRGGNGLNQAIKALKDPTPETLNPDEGPQYGASNDQATADYRHLYLGLSYLKKGQAKLALNTLGQIESNTLTQTVQWYQALCYVQLGKVFKAKQLLDQIRKQSGHPYSAEARKLATSFAPSTQ